jgi:hypothetical protein
MSISQPDRYEDGGIILSNHAKKKLAKELARRSEGETMDSISVQFTRDQIFERLKIVPAPEATSSEDESEGGEAGLYEDGEVVRHDHVKKRLATELARRSDGESVASLSGQFTRAEIFHRLQIISAPVVAALTPVAAAAGGAAPTPVAAAPGVAHGEDNPIVFVFAPLGFDPDRLGGVTPPGLIRDVASILLDRDVLRDASNEVVAARLRVRLHQLPMSELEALRGDTPGKLLENCVELVQRLHSSPATQPELSGSSAASAKSLTQQAKSLGSVGPLTSSGVLQSILALREKWSDDQFHLINSMDAGASRELVGALDLDIDARILLTTSDSKLNSGMFADPCLAGFLSVRDQFERGLLELLLERNTLSVADTESSALHLLARQLRTQEWSQINVSTSLKVMANTSTRIRTLIEGSESFMPRDAFCGGNKLISLNPVIESAAQDIFGPLFAAATPLDQTGFADMHHLAMSLLTRGVFWGDIHTVVQQLLHLRAERVMAWQAGTNRVFPLLRLPSLLSSGGVTSVPVSSCWTLQLVAEVGRLKQQADDREQRCRGEAQEAMRRRGSVAVALSAPQISATPTAQTDRSIYPSQSFASSATLYAVPAVASSASSAGVSGGGSSVPSAPRQVSTASLASAGASGAGSSVPSTPIQVSTAKDVVDHPLNKSGLYAAMDCWAEVRKTKGQSPISPDGGKICVKQIFDGGCTNSLCAYYHSDPTLAEREEVLKFLSAQLNSGRFAQKGATKKRAAKRKGPI